MRHDSVYAGLTSQSLMREYVRVINSEAGGACRLRAIWMIVCTELDRGDAGWLMEKVQRAGRG